MIRYMKAVLQSGTRGVTLLALSVAAFAAAGCGGSSVDLDKEYGLAESANERGPWKTIASLLGDLEGELRQRDVAPVDAVAMAKENVESYQPEQFGDKAAEFEKIVTGLIELEGMVKSNAPKQQLMEKANALKSQADQYAAAAAPAE